MCGPDPICGMCGPDPFGWGAASYADGVMTTAETDALPPAGHSQPAPGRGRTFPPVELLVFVVGISTLGAEIAAARLMAPFFGASTIVWANTIAIVLVALSIGYWLGGRLAGRYPTMSALCTVVLGAAVLLGLVPFVADPFLSLSVEAFDEVSVGAFAGSLFGVLALVAVPVLMLGTVAPWAIRLRVERVEDSGEIAGRLYAISTVGSLLGTFMAALLLIPLIGTQRTFLTFAVMIAAVSALGVGRRSALLAPLALAALMAVPVGVVKASDDEGRVIHEADTELQYARVVEYPDGKRHLELNEGQAVHSVWRADTVLTGDYWDGFLVAPLASRDAPPEHVAILGSGAGTTVRAYAHYFPETTIDAVEIDGELLDIGKEYFGLRERPQLREFAEDARPFLRRSDGGYDAIFVDAYRQPYIPFYLATREFFELARDRLSDDGVLAINVGHPEGSDELEKVLTATLRSVFENVARDPFEPTNTVLIATKDRQPSPESLRDGAEDLPPELAAVAHASAGRLEGPLEGGTVYTDDKAPVEWLVDKSIVEYAADGGE
jgi:spermidine synthase